MRNETSGAPLTPLAGRGGRTEEAMNNDCLRPASLVDFVQFGEYKGIIIEIRMEIKKSPLKELYDAEWRLRGYKETP
jgi:hypothetical protein